MAHQLREDKNCLNCGNQVEERFCSHCGQENTEPRQSFHYLITHFLSDFVHYEGSFWKSVKTLLFKPGKLTNEYLAGKRASYVAPVKLYIFISFVAFFLPAILPDDEKKEKEPYIKIAQQEESEGGVTYGTDFINVKSVAEMDSIQKALPEERKLNWVENKVIRKLVEVRSNSDSAEQYLDKISNAITHNSSKVFFIYLPIFAFWLWLFHGKKKWYLFDHGIFTLHYFSLILIAITFIIIVSSITDLFPRSAFINWLGILIMTAVVFYTFFYFFRAHSTVYKEKKWILRLKGFALFIINMICILFVTIAFFLIIVLNVS